MGTVYLAHDSQLERPVALKVPRFSADDGPEVRQRFLSEARAAATIEHPNICPVYDVGESDGILYLTMAYLEGPSLAQLLQERNDRGTTPLPPRQAVALVSKLARALQEAHDRGIIHRDLKPSNVILNPRGEPILLDFGLARRLRHADARLTQSGQPLGTPAYMSPEQVFGAVQVMGPGCDVYSLGVILYQLLTGRLPFEGSMAEVLAQIVTRRPDPLSKHRPDLDPRLEAICQKALCKEIAERYAAMRDFAAALDDYVHGNSPAVGQVANLPGVPTGRRPAPRARWALLAGGAAAVVLLAAVVWWMVPSKGAVRIELDDPQAAVEVQVDGEAIDSPGLKESLRLRPGKHHLLVTGKNIQPVNEFFTVVRGENPPLRVRLVLNPLRREHDDEDHDRRHGGEREREKRHREDDGREKREREIDD
jgi:hypothetical protein